MDSLLNSGSSSIGFAGSAAKAGWGVVAPETISGASSDPKSFDLVKGETAGKFKLVRCYYQIQDIAIDCADEPEFDIAEGRLWAVINTSVVGGQVTAVIGWTYDPNAPELVGVRLYILNANGGIVCDCRGSQVVIYG